MKDSLADNISTKSAFLSRKKPKHGFWIIVFGILITPFLLSLAYYDIDPEGLRFPIMLSAIFPYGSIVSFLQQNVAFVRMHDDWRLFFGIFSFVLNTIQFPTYGLILFMGINNGKLLRYAIFLIVIHIVCIAVDSLGFVVLYCGFIEPS